MLFALVIILSWLMTTCGIFVFLTLSNTGIPAGYGRYSNPKPSGQTLPANLAWIIQESPAFFIPAFFYWNTEILTRFGEFLLVLLLINYGYRTFIFPFLLKSENRTPVEIVAMAFGFCVWNGFIQGTWNARYQPEYEEFHPKFLVHLGVVMFFTGFLLHIISDLYLISLRRSTPTASYTIPHGLLFNYISCPNYFGECLEWIGYALAARSFPAIAFAFFTVCNLAPRAMSHHKWYKERFGEKYPKDRKALVPMIW